MQPFQRNVRTVDKKNLVMFANNNEADQHAHLHSSSSALFFMARKYANLLRRNLRAIDSISMKSDHPPPPQTKAQNSMHVRIVLELLYSFSILMTIVPSTKTQNRLCTANIKKIECLVTCYNAFDFEKLLS